MNMKLQRNMSFSDQIFRITMGLALIYIGPFSDILTSDTLSAVLLTIVGVLIIISSLIGWCPFYHMAGFNTYNANENKE